MPRHGSATGTATERQQPLPCRLQAPAGNAAVFPGQAPHLGEPFFLGNVPELSDVPDARSAMRQGRYRQSQLAAYRGKGACRRTALPFGPAPRSTQVVHGGKASRPPGKERLFTSGACHLRAFGLWKLVHRSTLRQRPGVPGNALRAFFVVFRSWGRGRRQAGLQGLGRWGRSKPFWRIEKWLTSA